MRTKLLFLVSAWILASTVPLLSGQSSTTTRSSLSSPCNSPLCQPATLTPFTAKFKTTFVHVLGDGTTVSNLTTSIEALDSKKRFLHITTARDPEGSDTPWTTVSVGDPATGRDLSWDSKSKTVREVIRPTLEQLRSCGGSGPPQGNAPQPSPPRNPMLPDRAPAAASIPGNGMNRAQREDLGTMMIGGVEATGYRMTMTIPAGRIGNDRPMVNTTEIWTAPSLGLQVRSVTQDPRMGSSTKELVSFEQGEPDPALFEPPADYRVVVQDMNPCGGR